VSNLPRVIIPHPHVRVDQKVLGGSPYVAGSRIPVRRLISAYRSGTSVEKLLLRYPQLTPSQVLDALSFALDNPEVIEADLEQEAVQLETRKSKVKPAVQQAQFDFLTEHEPPKAAT